MSPLTIYLGRFFGVSCLLMCGGLLLRPRSAIAAVQSVAQSPGLVLITGVFTLAGGVACVVGHDIWSGGALSVAVTVLGWLTLIKGLALVIAPPGALMRFYRALHYPRRFRVVMAVGTVFSAWLTVLAFQA